MENKKKILIVDDDQDIVKIIKMRLTYEGFDVIEAFEGLDGIEKARSLNPDLIVLDLLMPRVTGFEVLKILKLDEKYKHIPILVLTGQSEKCYQKFGLALGANDFMFKPFVSDELVKKVKEMLNNGPEKEISEKDLNVSAS